jgi:hypothetical protein
MGHSSSYKVIKTGSFKSLFPGFLVNFFQGENLCKEIYTGVFLEEDKGRQHPRNGLDA